MSHLEWNLTHRQNIWGSMNKAKVFSQWPKSQEFDRSFQTGKMSLCGEGSSSNKTKLVTIHFEASLEEGKKKRK